MKLFLKSIPPFNFDLNAQIFADGDEQIRKYQGGRFWQILKANEKLVLVSLQGAGMVDKPALQAELKSERPLSRLDIEAVRDTICWIFNLDFDLKPFYKIAKNDAILDHITSRLYGLRSPATPTVFEALIDSLIEQQISLQVAQNLEKRLIKKFGDKLKIEDNAYYAYPTPERLAAADVSHLRECCLSSKKAEYVKNVSELMVKGKLDLERLARLRCNHSRT